MKIVVTRMVAGLLLFMGPGYFTGLTIYELVTKGDPKFCAVAAAAAVMTFGAGLGILIAEHSK